MERSPCGFDCSRCPIYLATQSGDTQALLAAQKRLAAEGHHYSLEELRCLGCTQSKLLFPYCELCPKRSRA